MIRLLSRFLRKPAPAMSAHDLIAAGADKAANDRLNGFCLASFYEPGAKDAQAVLFCQGDIVQGLARALQIMLTKPESKEATTAAIVMALQASGGGGVVQMVPVMGCDDPDCPICTLRRVSEGYTTRSKPH